MIGNIHTITNLCNDKSITFCCEDFSIETFSWRDIERSNTKFNLDNQNGGYSTCYRDNIRVAEITVRYLSPYRQERGDMRSYLDQVFTNLDCCDICCNMEIQFTDDDGTEMIMYGKLGSSIVSDTVGGFDMIHDHKFDIEICGNIQGAEEVTVCGELGVQCGVQLPICTDGVCTTYLGGELVNYLGNVCGTFDIVIDWNPIENLQIRNLTTWGVYGINWTVNGEVHIDVANGTVTENGVTISPARRITGSSLNSLKLAQGENEILVTGVGEGTWCLVYNNQLA